ncbi:MAG: GGDEF domain-containing protein [Actinomycetota bacterium]|nr:GGDEF domain-containing protein [Actinomycetota bacterium]
MILNKHEPKEIVRLFRNFLEKEKLGDLWNEETEKTMSEVFSNLLACLGDDLYLQEFLPSGSIYRLAAKHGVEMRKRDMPIEKVMQEHIVLRDAFWEYKKKMSEREHDFATEKRICQCLNSMLQATVQSYQRKELVFDILDPLRDSETGVFNELYFLTRFEEELKRSERYFRDVAVLIFDVHLGFDLGSQDEIELMRAISRVLRRYSRASDILARIENSKFALLMPETRKENAEIAAERLKTQLADYLNKLGGSFSEVNIEVGIASYPEHGEDSEALLEEATESIRRETS